VEGLAQQAAVAMDNAQLYQSAQQEIHQRTLAEEALRRINEELRRANSDLEQFAYSASHDLQEPIRNISISGEILDRRYGHLLDGRAKEHLSFVTAGAKRMEMLVKDLLTYTRSGEMEGEVSPEADATVALEKALSDLATALGETDAKVHYGPLPVVRAREVHLQQLFQNLVGNALKYRQDAEPPLVRIAAGRHGSGWLFSVSDNGIGIPPEYRDRVFGIFKRLHGDGKYSGTGIGLAICKRIVERNGGRIWVESEGAGKGSTFYFTLPAGGTE
jgi:light-regulated signal transduction histidine kinase (bacteriophytochrome)